MNLLPLVLRRVSPRPGLRENRVTEMASGGFRLTTFQEDENG